jgi:hypothetical protein
MRHIVIISVEQLLEKVWKACSRSRSTVLQFAGLLYALGTQLFSSASPNQVIKINNAYCLLTCTCHNHNVAVACCCAKCRVWRNHDMALMCCVLLACARQIKQAGGISISSDHRSLSPRERRIIAISHQSSVISTPSRRWRPSRRYAPPPAGARSSRGSRAPSSAGGRCTPSSPCAGRARGSPAASRRASTASS